MENARNSAREEYSHRGLSAHVPVFHEVGGLGLTWNSLTGKKKRLHKPDGKRTREGEVELSWRVLIRQRMEEGL